MTVDASNPEQVVTIGEAARRAGLTAKAVRLYEARGLLPPAVRTASGYRCYSPADVQLLRFIRHARDLGLSLAEIRTIIGLRHGEAPPPSGDVIALLQTHLTVIERTITDLDARRRAMTSVLHTAAAHVRHGQPVRLCKILGTP